MIKKLTFLAMAIGALVAFAVPAMAGAAELTDEKGNPIEVGATVSATSLNAQNHPSSGGVLGCHRVQVNGIVSTNSNGTVAVSMDGATDIAEKCMLSGGPLMVAPTFTSLHVNGESGIVAFEFLVNGLCPESSGATNVDWVSGTDEFRVEAEVFGPGVCPDGTFTGDVTVIDHEGNSIIVD